MTIPTVMYDSPEAAKQVEVTLWQSIHGNLYRDESAARYDSCTHRKCTIEGCEAITQKMYTVCKAHRDEAEKKRYLALELTEWDQDAPLCTYRGDTYFWGMQEVIDWCIDNAVPPSQALLVICEKQTPRIIGLGDLYYDDLPEDGDFPDEVYEAYDVFHKILMDNFPECWREGNKRPILSDEEYFQASGRDA